ncbi:EAL domain-containing protein [Pseudomonas sp. Fl5BN2]|uniref:bifunctional diguanylate cyclase/phosphodiesterase n=1 Tax=unclassified Pseudomonas TaxID=196821 RepID=UPI0013772586|nr:MULTISPECIES: bifunctional diguanylate cyclase/phosphodiesterase [unclassified Pseudomonas]NBF06735.1 EAL domain-containing protein [Pseudomonas sp. Fl5BN2]NBF11781.1 EAL domain-containing protein [Pseudomonas sp. Fl4BN1]
MSLDLALNTSLLPIVLLQYVAMVGILSTLLMLRQDAQRLIKSQKMLLGLILGASNVALIALASEFMQTPTKVFLSNDMLFLAGLLGGWWGATACLMLVALARYWIAGPLQFEEALFSFSLMTLGGIALHRWFQSRDLCALNLRGISLVLLVRVGAAIAPMQVIAWMGTVDSSVTAHLLSLRLLSSLLSLPMFILIFAMLRREARYQQAQHRLLQQAVTDPITQLPNRRALGNHLEYLHQQPANQRGGHSLLVIQITNLKDLVAIHGHDWTDHLLIRLAQELQSGASSQVLQTSAAPRLFMFSTLSLALDLPDRSLQLIEESTLIASLQMTLQTRLAGDGGLSPKLQFCVIDACAGGSANITLRNISLALQDHRQAVHYLHRSLLEKAQSKELIRQQLQDWLRYDNPPLQYQPKFCLRQRTVIGAEALLRARDGQGAAISPLLILDVVRHQELLQAFEWATIEAVIRDAQDYQRAGLSGPLAVNVSADTLSAVDFATRLIQRLQEAGLPGRRLALELTENTLLQDTQQVAYNMLLLKDHGVILALDDFGTGYSALSILAKYPFGEVKIDHSMISLLHYERMRTAVSIALQSARLYEATLTAEGVETQEQIDILQGIGIHCAQGYFFSPAVPLAELIELGIAAECSDSDRAS